MFSKVSFPTLAAVAAAGLAVTAPASALVVLSGDANVLSAIEGDNGLPTDPANAIFALNVLGASQSVFIHAPVASTITPSAEALNRLYSAQPGVVSTLGATADTLPSTTFETLDLFVSVVPDAYSQTERDLLFDFAAAGGDVFLLGDNDNFASVQNGALNAVLAAIGSSMRLANDALDPGILSTATLSDPLTTGVGSLRYAWTSGITGGVPLALTSGGETFLAREGAVTVPAPPPIPLPLPAVLLAGALGGLSLVRRPA